MNQLRAQLTTATLASNISRLPALAGLPASVDLPAVAGLAGGSHGYPCPEN